MSALEPADYAATFEHIKRLVHHARFQAQRRVNTELLTLYWRIGNTIIERQQTTQWGSRVLEQLASDLRREFPEVKGFSSSNLKNMRRFATEWPDQTAIGQHAVGQLPWGHIVTLLESLDDQDLRDWYAAKDAVHGWSRAVLGHQIKTHLHLREAAAPSSFAGVLDRSDSDLAQELTKAPYTLDFLALDSDTTERELEDRLVDRIVGTLAELGAGFAFVGRQVHFDVDGDDFYVDLLFFNIEQLRYVVIELKTTAFDPRDTGQLGFYVALVEDRLRREHHRPTVGILLGAVELENIYRFSNPQEKEASKILRDSPDTADPFAWY